MIWEKWIPKKYLVKDTICGLEIQLTDEGFNYFYTILSHKKNKLEVTESGSGQHDFNLPAKIKKDKIPLVIGLAGKGLISKKVTLPEKNINYEDIVTQSLPTIDKSDFYIQIYPQKECDAYINIFRKERLNTLLRSLEQYDLADVFLGYSFITDATPLTSLFDRIVTNSGVIELSNGCINNVKIEESTQNPELSIDGLTLNKQNTMGFALCFVYLLNTKRQFDFSSYRDFRTIHTEKNKLRFLSRAAIFTAFALCLINYLFFNYYFSENKKLQGELDLYEDKYQQINELLTSYEEKKHVIEESGILNKELIAPYIDKIALTVPSDLILSDWKINPVIETETDSLIRFKKNNLYVKGNCEKSLLVNEWINVLKSLDFIKNVNMENYQFRSENNAPNFELKIELE